MRSAWCTADADDGYPVFVDALVNMCHTWRGPSQLGVVCLSWPIIETAPHRVRTWHADC